jgi:hypothetical protein
MDVREGGRPVSTADSLREPRCERLLPWVARLHNLGPRLSDPGDASGQHACSIRRILFMQFTALSALQARYEIRMIGCNLEK